MTFETVEQGDNYPVLINCTKQFFQQDGDAVDNFAMAFFHHNKLKPQFLEPQTIETQFNYQVKRVFAYENELLDLYHGQHISRHMLRMLDLHDSNPKEHDAVSPPEKKNTVTCSVDTRLIAVHIDEVDDSNQCSASSPKGFSNDLNHPNAKDENDGSYNSYLEPTARPSNDQDPRIVIALARSKAATSRADARKAARKAKPNLLLAEEDDGFSPSEDNSDGFFPSYESDADSESEYDEPERPQRARLPPKGGKKQSREKPRLDSPSQDHDVFDIADPMSDVEDERAQTSSMPAPSSANQTDQRYWELKRQLKTANGSGEDDNAPVALAAYPDVNRIYRHVPLMSLPASWKYIGWKTKPEYFNAIELDGSAKPDDVAWFDRMYPTLPVAEEDLDKVLDLEPEYRPWKDLDWKSKADLDEDRV